MNNDKKEKYIIDKDDELQKDTIIFAMKCADDEEMLSCAIRYFTNGKVSLDDYTGDGRYEDLYQFILANGFTPEMAWEERKRESFEQYMRELENGKKVNDDEKK